MTEESRRDTLSILSDLLENMHEPRRITHLLYASNLSYSQLSKYLKMIVNMGLVQELKKPFHSFKVTPDGKFFLNLVNKRNEKENPIPTISKLI